MFAYVSCSLCGSLFAVYGSEGETECVVCRSLGKHSLLRIIFAEKKRSKR